MALLLAAAGMMAGGLVGLEMIHRRNQREALRAMLSDPDVLSELAYIRMMEDAQLVWVLIVHVESAQLASKLANTRLQVRVKYGEPGRSLLRHSQTVKSVRGEDGAVWAAFGDTVLFPLRPDLRQVVRVRLARLGIVDRVLSKAEFDLPFTDSTGGAVTKELALHSQQKHGEVLGLLRVTAEVRAVPRRELRRAALLDLAGNSLDDSAADIFGPQVPLATQQPSVVHGRVLQGDEAYRPGTVAGIGASGPAVVLGVPVARAATAVPRPAPMATPSKEQPCRPATTPVD